MLNELFVLERGLSTAGLAIEVRHPDIKALGRAEALRVRLGPGGMLAAVEPVARELVAKLWTLRDGQHNSFPFIQIKRPLLTVPEASDKEWWKSHRERWKSEKPAGRRRALGALATRFPCRGGWRNSWPGAGFRTRLQERLILLESLRQTDGAAVPAVIERFLVATEQPHDLLARVTEALLAEIEEGDDQWLEAAHQVLIDGGSLYLDVARGGFPHDVGDPRQVALVSGALGRFVDDEACGRCALTGETAELLRGNFPQPNLPLLGQTYLFSKNADIPAAGRYERFAAEAFPIRRELAERLDASIRELTREERRGKTWRDIPGERPKQNDLLLAFVQAVPDAPIADVMADDGERTDPIAVFEGRTTRALDAIKASVRANFRETPVQVSVLRRVDPANRKVIYHRRLTVEKLFDAATAWRLGASNLPPWLRMPVPEARPGKVRQLRPPHVAPLQVPYLTRWQYIRGGKQRQELTGLSSVQAFALFLNEGDDPQARSALTLTLRRCGALLSGCAHALRGGMQDARSYDRIAALRAITFMGVLLNTLRCDKERYMNETAFKLGQLLAAADVIHVGYCADVRGGAVPPTLLGNAVLPIAQSNPAKALSVLSRRWKPYGSWAKRVNRAEAEGLRNSDDAKQRARGWAIIRAVSQARRADDLARDLHDHLSQKTNDVFRAELLLGYIAGLPPRAGEASESDDSN